MDLPPLDKVRNIGIISHIDAGKTTVSERILYYSGEIHRMGEVHEGAATMDWMDQEQQRGITITATSNACHWNDLWINLIDTPGHIDFTIEVERSLRVLDGAIAIFSAVEGVQPQSESVWRQAERYRVPRLCLINKMDRVGADYRQVLEQMEQRLRARPALLQLPVGSEGDFSAVLDLVTEEKVLFFEEDLGRTVRRQPVPEELQESLRQGRERLVETAADFDESVMEDFLEGRRVSGERLLGALRRGTLALEIYPVLLGSALRNKGIQPLLDAVGSLLPSPLETPPVEARSPDGEQSYTLKSEENGPLCALAFKVLSDEGRKLTYLRLYSGSLRMGDSLWCSGTGSAEKLARLFRMHAHKRERMDQARAGDIVAATGLKGVLTGDTLCSPERPLVLTGMSYPDPVVSLAVEPKGVDDREKLLPALEKLQWEDPTFKVREDEGTGQTILTGMGELHLEVVTTRLERDFGVQVKTGRPQVVYRETLLEPVRHRETFQREIDGKPQSAELLFTLTPLPRGEGLQIELTEAALSSLPPHLAPILGQSLEAVCASGVRTGYPLTDLSVTVLEAPFEPGTTTELALRAAAQRGVVMACQKGEVVLLEPVMQLEITAPSEQTGRVHTSLVQKRGMVEGMVSREEIDIIRAKVPLCELFGYMTELRSATKGRGTFTMEFSHYDQAPSETQQRFGLR